VIDAYAPGLSSCFGDLDASLLALRTGRRGTQKLADVAGFDLPGVAVVYADPAIDVPYQRRAEAHLRRALRRTLGDLPAPLGGHQAGGRTAVVVCTGLGATPGDEAAVAGVGWTSIDAVAREEVGPGVDCYSITNACSASGAGLALASDLLTTDAYDQVVLAAADSMTRAMLTMIGKVAAEAAAYCAPFDRRHTGAVLGEGAASCILRRSRDRRAAQPYGTVRAIECSSDAGHPTAPDPVTIDATIRRAVAAAGPAHGPIDFVVPHGTGTMLNDECESAVYGAMPELNANASFFPLKGGIGHTSGASFLMSLLVAMSLCRGAPAPGYVPEDPVEASAGLRWTAGPGKPRRGLVCAYGFGGANAVGVVTA